MRTLLFATAVLAGLTAAPALAVDAERQAAPAFDIEDVDGFSVRSEALRGKVVVLNFWFIGCPPCRAEMPELNALVDAHQTAEDVVFLAFSTDSQKAVEQFLDHNRFRYRVVPNARTVADAFGISAFPTHVVLDQEGRIVTRLTGSQQIRARLAATIASVRTPVSTAAQPEPTARIPVNEPLFPQPLRDVLAQLRKSKRTAAAADAFAKRVAARLAGDPYRRFQLVAGRVTCADGSDPSEVMMQSAVDSQGLFITDLGDRLQPLSFRRAGFEPYDYFLPNGDVPNLVWAEVVLRPTPPKRQAVLRGRFVDELGKPVPGVTALLSVSPGPTNHKYGAGLEGREHWPEPLPVTVKGDGSFELRGLAPIEYMLTANAPGFTPVMKGAPLVPGGREDLGELVMEHAVKVTIRWRPYPIPPGYKAQQVELKPGDLWDPAHIRVEQRDGKVYFSMLYGGWSIRRIGLGEVERCDAAANCSQQTKFDTRTQPIEDGTVYLATDGRHDTVLFEVKLSGATGAQPSAAPADLKVAELAGCTSRDLPSGVHVRTCPDGALRWWSGKELNADAFHDISSTVPANAAAQFMPCSVSGTALKCTHRTLGEERFALEASVTGKDFEALLTCTWSGDARVLPAACADVLQLTSAD